MKEEVTVIVPASTSNLGPGFDTLGLALSWRVQCRARRINPGSGPAISVKDAAPGEWERPFADMIAHAAARWEAKSRESAAGVSLEISGDVPLARGLGSSAAYRLAALAAINALAKTPLPDDALLATVCELEQHTDNAVPCMAGGLTVSGWEGGKVRYVSWPVDPELSFAALVPDLELETEKARMALPQSVPREDAVQNLQRALWLVSAIAANRPDKLAGVFSDRLHQPYRTPLIPFLPDVITAAQNAGAYGAFLSGSGSTIIAVTDPFCAEDVARSMLETMKARGRNGFTRILDADNEGMKII